MPFGLKVLDLAEQLAAHAEARQALISRNVANADTPGYRAVDLVPFSESYAAQAAADEGGFAPKATRPGHEGFAPGADAFRETSGARLGAASPNGNDVSLEDQMIRAADLRMEQELAIGVWRKSLDILRASLGR